jgi:hypothetical protein
MAWQEVPLRSQDFMAFCQREGLPGEHPGPAMFTSEAPPGNCNVTAGLLWRQGSRSPFLYRLFCKKSPCASCGPWQAGKRLTETAKREGLDLTPDFVSQIYIGSLRGKCESTTQNQLHAVWFRDDAPASTIHLRLRRQAGRLRKKGQRVEYFAVMARRSGWWVLSTVELWPTNAGRGRPSKVGPGVPVTPAIGLAWLFGILASGMGEEWTRSRGWAWPKSDSAGYIRLGMAGTAISSTAKEMLDYQLGEASEAELRVLGASAIADARALKENGVPCRSCGCEITESDSAAWDASLGFVCLPCLEVEIQNVPKRHDCALALGPSEEDVLADATRGLLVRGPATELAVERWLRDQGFLTSFFTDGDLLRRSLALVGAVCHPDGRWGFAQEQSSVAGQ